MKHYITATLVTFLALNITACGGGGEEGVLLPPVDNSGGAAIDATIVSSIDIPEEYWVAKNGRFLTTETRTSDSCGLLRWYNELTDQYDGPFGSIDYKAETLESMVIYSNGTINGILDMKPNPATANVLTKHTSLIEIVDYAPYKTWKRSTNSFVWEFQVRHKQTNEIANATYERIYNLAGAGYLGVATPMLQGFFEFRVTFSGQECNIIGQIQTYF
jgi:hypothetical protein